ncbi:MAG TPA: PilZ domain-containing protein [Smithellaceae bacterium]|nr:PilZ domain-containing protein [Smithellaceae bacterium]
MTELKIGTRIDIIFDNEINKSNAHYMKASVYDYADDMITVSQTSPALNRNFLNRRIMVSFLARVERRVLRFGFSARLIDLITNYEIASTNRVEALVLKQLDEPGQVDFRMHFRVSPPASSAVNLFYQEERVNLVDISIGGAKFAYPKTYAIRPADKMKFKLIIGAAIFDVNARVCNVVMPDAYAVNKNIQYVSVKFEHDNRQTEAALGRAIIEIERLLLSEGKI